MNLTKKQSELRGAICVAVYVDMEQYKKHRSLRVATRKEDQFGHAIEADTFYDTRIVKALFEKGLVEYLWGNDSYPKTKFRKNEKVHHLVPSGFVHPDFGWKVGDIGLKEFTCGSTTYEKCYGVCIKVEDGVLTFRPLNFSGGSTTWNRYATTATKHTIEEAMEYIKSQVAEIPNKTYMSC